VQRARSRRVTRGKRSAARRRCERCAPTYEARAAHRCTESAQRAPSTLLAVVSLRISQRAADGGSRRAAVAMEGHVVDKAAYVGRFRRTS
jgi:hypothetical protein